ncbi:hypothetical protein ACC674_39660, partial [Rhizobium ruizarguesonis]
DDDRGFIEIRIGNAVEGLLKQRLVTNEEFRFLVAEQAHELAIPLAAVLLEPVARNTTAAVAAAATLVGELFGKKTI